MDEIKTRSRLAAAELQQLKEAEDPDFSLAYGCIRNYVYAKFLLSESECSTEKLREISICSVRKAMKLQGKDVPLQDVSGGCRDISSVEAKKVLLFVSVQNALEIRFPAIETAYYETISDLTEAVLRALRAARSNTVAPAV
ncbi:MAG: hypothetical protein ACI4PC_06875 [Oscillospiraceae bacterium]